MLALAAAEPVARPVWTGPGASVQGMPSPDGRFLTAIDPSTGDLAIRELAGSRLHRLTHRPSNSKEFAYFSAVSPGSNHIAYAWFNDAGFYDLRLIATQGGEPRLLFRNEEAGFVQPCDWTPDGRFILTLLFRKDNISQITLIAAEDGNVRVLKSLNWVYPKKMDISPDGKWIVYDSFAAGSQSQRDIYILALDGSRESTLITGPAEDGYPLWTPDGKSVVFASNRLGTNDLFRIPVENGKASGEPELLQKDLDRFLPMGITTDGTLYFGRRSGARDVFLVSLPAGEPKRLSSRFHGANLAPAFSRDGQYLAYLTRQGAENFGTESRVVTIRSLKTGAERQIAPKLAHMERLRWSPDNKSLLISGSDGKGRSGLFRVDITSSQARPIVWDDNASFRGIPGDWLDADRVVIGGSDLRERNLLTGDERLLDKRAARLVAVSAEGKVAFASYNEVFRLDQGSVYKGEVTSLAWAAEELYVATPEALIAGGRKLPLPDYDLGSLSIDPGARQLVYSGGRVANEVWSLKLP